MSPPVILLSAAFTGLVCLAAGLLLLQRLNVPLMRGERIPLGFLLGSAALSTTVFLLLTVWLGRPWLLALLGVATIGYAVHRRAWRTTEESRQADSLPGYWRWIFGAALVFYGGFTFFYAMAPETSPDGTAYHLGLVARYLRSGGFGRYTLNMYANLPMGVEMIYLFAFAFGKHSAAALVHWQFLLAMPFVLLAIGRRFGSAKTGIIAGLIMFMSPVVMIDGSTAYVDTATASVVCGLFLALVAWEQTRHRAWLPIIGILAGWSYCCKMTAAPAVVFALLYVLWATLRRRGERSWRPVLTVGLIAAALIAPWLIKNAIVVDNPFSPFLNRYFPNPYVRVSFEEEYRAVYRTYYGQITSWTQIPLEVAVKGGTLNGLLGPIFLFAPVALLALRWPLGRRAWIAALFMASTYPGNIGTRFLISAAPFLALAMAQLFDRWRVGVAVVAFHALLAWPDIIGGYADQYAWRLDRFRWTQAWRIEAEDTFLARMLDGYRMATLANSLVPADARIFTYGGATEAYMSRDLTVAYQSGEANAAGEMLAAGVASHIAASRTVTFRFPVRQISAIRLSQTANVAAAKGTDIWSLSEVRILGGSGAELSRQPSWRIQAKPNPWDVAWAFDNSPVTRWKTWELAVPGEYVEVNFGAPLELSGVRLETSTDQSQTRVRLDSLMADSRWKTISDQPEIAPLAPPADLRRRVCSDLKRLGYTHLIVSNGEFLAKDLFATEADWGLTLLADTGTGRLYRID